MPIRNPLGPEIPVWGPYSYQRVNMTGGRGYVKVKHNGKVFDTALTVRVARSRIESHAALHGVCKRSTKTGYALQDMQADLFTRKGNP